MSRPTAPVLAVLLLAAAVVAAGCVAPAGEVAPDAAADSAGGVPDGWWANAVPSSTTDPKHSHSDRAMHADLTTPNFEVVGWDPLATEYYGETPTGMGCGGTITREDGRRIAIVHTISTDVAFIVADVTDPAAPVKLGEYLMPNAVIWDADLTADGMHVLVGAYPPAFGDPTPVLPPVPPYGHSPAAAFDAPLPGDTPDVWRVQPLWRDACTGEVRAAGPEQYLPFGPGIVMVGVQDPTDPTFEDWVSQPVIGPHSVSSAMIDGTVYAMSSVTNLQHESSYYTFFTVETLPTGAGKLVPYTAIEVPGHPGPTALNGHIDVTLEKHPVTGQLVAYLANWDGMYIYDVSNPALPTELSSFFDAGAVHTTFPFPDMRDDKRYLVVGQEVGEPVDLPSGWVYILDVTDPTAPAEVGRWTLPVKPKWDDGGLMFSPHYVAILNDTMFVSNYHGGLWAVDISDMAEPLASGIFVPDREPPAPLGGGSYGPSIEDVIVDPATGLLTTWDGAGGVYVLRFDEEMPSPRAPAWVEGDAPAT